ncbi:N-acetylmuramoyl-L-alanine amidase [Melghirimyces algeriensis]|uniref:N-acetylmuramoyl-L-alanine amidase n=1 Tax=Melghirimyces algeriensis TaxID=910412 RepID=A0A521FAI5_9BACL|nr:N-acetylmuramoyl-L-alanine amidase [Melghirimyces algeriensis]SMO93054.1 N-acetylmuramoyl-L-alanine amidase [Melghirimyces algeriensis]
MSKVVVIDPGHGGKDPGATGHGLKEKDLTLKISKYAYDYLESNYEGVKVYMTRTKDTYPSLSGRCRYEKSKNADLFCSIHVNAGGGNGFESYVLRGAYTSTRRKQKIIHDEIMKVCPSGWRDRGRKQAGFYVLKHTRSSAILTENGFIDTKSNADDLKKDSFLKKLGYAHAKGIAKALGLKRKTKEEGKGKNKGEEKKKLKEFWRIHKNGKQIGYYDIDENARKMIHEVLEKSMIANEKEIDIKVERDLKYV